MQVESSAYGENGGSDLAWGRGFDEQVRGLWPSFGGSQIPKPSGIQNQFNTQHSAEYGLVPFGTRTTKVVPDINWLYVVWSRQAPSSQSAFETETMDVRPRISGPIQFVNGLLETWRLRQSDATSLLGFEADEWPQVESILNGTGNLSGRDVKDRIACLFEIRRTLSSLFKNQTVENNWLREIHPLLNERKPLDLLLEGSMENLLLVRDYVELAAGR